jgi:hypothetical protein
MQIVVSVSSCLIDLRKASLLDIFLRLPYEFLIPNTLFEEELLKFTAAQKKALIHSGLKVIDLSGERVLRKIPQLSVHDGFAFALAESQPGCILLTGDSKLRALAINHAIEAHGVLWVLDEIHRMHLTSVATLLDVLHLFATDPTVRLPRRDLRIYIKRYEKINSQS